MSQGPKTTAKPNVVELVCRDQQIHKVTVYNDRAEVVRVVKTDIQAGINEIHVKNVTNCLVKDSIRVDGLGDVLIHEVQTVNKPVMEEEKDSPKVAEIRSRRDAQRKEVAKIKGRQGVLKKKELALENLISQLGSKLESDSAVNNIEKLFTFHDSETEIVRETLFEVEESLVKAEKELNKLELEFRKATKSELNYQYATTFVIALESKHDGKIQLYLTYQVLKASWFPTYDIRVDTYSSGPMMRMTYFGQISQSTGEDWLEVPITLSTSQPSLGGNIPELGTLEVKFLQAPPPTPVIQQARAMTLGRLQRGVEERFAVENSVDSISSTSMKKFDHAVARDVKDQVLSTEFTISRPGAVPSGGDVHKVTIGMISMVPQLSHECVPRKSSSVFLAASMINDSPFPLLRGEASVFLNNSFVNKVELKSVSPGEKFTCSLGVDPGIRVVYKPVKTYHEKSGMISKWSLVNTEQEITIRNTRKSAIVLTVKEQIPRSVEDKIKVRLLHPVNYVALDKEPTHVAWMDANEQQGVRLTKANNLEWTVQMHDGQVLDLVVKYSIEHPSDQTLSFLESH